MIESMTDRAPKRRARIRRILALLLCAGLTCGVNAPLPHTALAAGKSAHPEQLVPGGWPKQIVIPRIKVHATIEQLALDRASDVHAPYQWGDAGWYKLGPRPGDMGHAVIFGHLDSTCCPAVFWNLKALKPGDTLRVTYRTGKSVTFRVMWGHTYATHKFPLHWVLSGVRQRSLVLFTCAGVFHYDGSGYDHKLMVYARMVLPGGHLG